jgi:hypothetical protein
MVEADKKEFAIAVGALFASFGQDSTQALMQGYWLGLNDLELHQVQIAVASALKRCKFLPRPAELRELLGLNVSDEDTAVAAWGDVLRAVRLGPYKHVDFEDKLCNAVIRNLGGWVTFLQRFSDAESEKWTRLDFVKCYKAFAKSGVNGELIAPLQGLSEREVINGQLCLPVPRKIDCDANRNQLPFITHFAPCSVPKIEKQIELKGMTN